MVLLRRFPPLTEGIRFQQANTNVNIDGENLGSGTLFISESCVAWQKEGGEGFVLQYPAISCHAISRDLNAFPQECLYVMVDGKLPGEECASEEEEEEEEGGEGDNDSEPDLSEVRLIPADKNMLEPMFTAMSDCQALHPDPEDVDSEDELYHEEEEEEEEEEFTENGMSGFATSGAGQSTGEAHAQLSHFADVLQLGQGDGPGMSGVAPSVVSAAGDAWNEEEEQGMEVGQFQDAEDME
ncbi:methylosome subunit pICln-like [Babylonia areolata]|uniref:methylosome subunit pICln-like n=1 Tax=Babylonia areolata TaxID=304850 RepID=UPI003FD4E9C5